MGLCELCGALWPSLELCEALLRFVGLCEELCGALWGSVGLCGAL